MQLLLAEVSRGARRAMFGAFALVSVTALIAAIAPGHHRRGHRLRVAGACAEGIRREPAAPPAPPAPACTELQLVDSSGHQVVRTICGPIQTIRLDAAGRLPLAVVPRHDPDGVLAPFRPTR
jgi:hypothetical protein